jgi:LPS O-antigen subunit length determinant protein (WzzB/FepE family)
MIEIERIQQDINELPEEAQSLLVDYIQFLKQRYSQPKLESTAKAKSLFERFNDAGFIGCCAVEEDLSTTYKDVLTDLLESKYDHR